MTGSLYLPTDQFAGNSNDHDLSADYLELSAFFSPEKQSLSQDIVDTLELAADEDFNGVEDELQRREEAASGAVGRIVRRGRYLRDAYPFTVDESGDVISFGGVDDNLGRAAYMLSLVLSHLHSVSDVFTDAALHPSEAEVRQLRNFFQYFATAALAAEVGGPAWSFGHPRPDGTGFLAKLKEIWMTLRDGVIEVDPSAPDRPKDDQIDVFAWREQKDGLPGFLLAAAQVATGRNWKEKSVKCHINGPFNARWFGQTPVTMMVPYHIVPFALADRTFRDDVLVLGNVLHRTRMPVRVLEASQLVARGTQIEAYDKLGSAVTWLGEYEARAQAA